MDVLHTNLVEYHGFLSNEKFIGSLGGQVQQLYYILNEIIKKFPHDLATYMKKQLENTDAAYFDKAHNLRELC